MHEASLHTLCPVLLRCEHGLEPGLQLLACHTQGNCTLAAAEAVPPTGSDWEGAGAHWKQLGLHWDELGVTGSVLGSCMFGIMLGATLTALKVTGKD